MDKVLLVGEALCGDGDLRRVIEREGFAVTGAAGREEALHALAAAAPAVAIIEHGPEDGLDLLRDIRAAFPACDVILVVGQGGEIELAIDALRAGALDYLRRPLDHEQLRLALGRAKERRPQKRALQPPSILLLEDHELTRRRLGSVLEKEGYRVRTAADGEEGLALFQAERFDLIVADLRMPRRDGLEVLRATRGKGADVEVIVVTGHGDEEVVVQALREGAANFLRKPIDIEQLLHAVERALEVQTLRRSLAYRNRDVEIMQELVLRLTRRLEVVVEAPGAVSTQALDFLTRLGDALPLGLIMAAADGSIVFANRHVTEKLAARPARLSAEWLAKLGLWDITQPALDEAMERVLRSESGDFQTLVLNQWAFVIMAPLRLLRADGTQQLVALAVRGERGPAVRT
jgi:DNA-binding NtrC family response regulator